MRTAERDLPELLNELRWVLPALMAVLGVGYTVLEHAIIFPGPVILDHVVREAIIIGTLGPALTWVLLTWATRIAHARESAESALAQRALQLETASRVGRQATTILDIDHLLEEVVDLIHERFGYYHVDIFLVDDAQDEVVLRESSGCGASAIKEAGLRLGVGREGIVGRVAQTGGPLMCNDVRRESHFLSHELVPKTRSELAVPLQVGGSVVGVLDVQSDRRDAFDTTDVESLQIVASQIAIAMENARLFQETRERFQAMRALYETALDIVSRLESGQVLEAILRRAADLLGAQAGTLGIYDPESNQVRKIAVYNVPAEYQGVALSVGEGVSGKVVETGEPLIVNNYLEWAGRSPIFADGPYDAVLGVPLRWQGEIIGSLDVLDLGDSRPFQEDDVWLLSTLADLASIAIKNVELYSEVRALNDELEHRVTVRTEQLAEARAELAQKASQLQDLLSRTINVQEEERARIARDMHDSTTQLILGALYATQAAVEGLPANPAEARDNMLMVQQFLQQIEEEIRQAIYDLRPLILDAEGVVPALKQYLERFERLANVPCPVCVSGVPVRLPGETEVAIFRIVQEALQNVMAHADAGSAYVRIEFGSQAVHVTVEDDGRGFDPADATNWNDGHLGLLGMQERASNIGAHLHVDSTSGQGTRVKLEVPIAQSSYPGEGA